MSGKAQQQLLHIVIGGELVDFDRTAFKDIEKIETVGIFPSYATAYVAWKAKAQQTVDNAHMRYFIVHLHRLLDPVEEAKLAAARVRLAAGSDPLTSLPVRKPIPSTT